MYQAFVELEGSAMKQNLRTSLWKDGEADEKCGPGFKVREKPPDLATDLNGVQLPTTCFEDDSKGLHHVFVIGDWGGVIDWYDKSKGFVHPPKTADHTTKAFSSHARKKVKSSDDWAQYNVSKWFCNRAEESDPDFVINLGDNFYWGGLNVQCGGPMHQPQDPAFQWSNVYEKMYHGTKVDGKQWLSILGNHDYGGFLFTNGWDQVIAYTWSKMEFSTGRWMQPALYYATPIKYNDFSVDIFFVDSNVWDAFDYHATSGHNICGMSHNYQDATCGITGPMSVEQCAQWFKDLWDAEVKWMKDGLGKSSADWQFIATHFPVEHGLDQWKDLATTFGVDLILTAHRHIQEVHGPDDESNLVAPTAWIVSGGGGGITSEAEPTENGEDDQYGFMDLTLSKHEIKITAVSHGGQIRQTRCITQRMPGDKRTQRISGSSLCDGEPSGVQPLPTKMALTVFPIHY